MTGSHPKPIIIIIYQLSEVETNIDIFFSLNGFNMLGLRTTELELQSSLFCIG